MKMMGHAFLTRRRWLIAGWNMGQHLGTLGHVPASVSTCSPHGSYPRSCKIRLQKVKCRLTCRYWQMALWRKANRARTRSIHTKLCYDCEMRRSCLREKLSATLHGDRVRGSLSSGCSPSLCLSLSWLSSSISSTGSRHHQDSSGLHSLSQSLTD